MVIFSSLLYAYHQGLSSSTIILSALVVYFYFLKKIFYPGHRDSFLYTNFFRTRHTLYLTLYILVTFSTQIYFTDPIYTD